MANDTVRLYSDDERACLSCRGKRSEIETSQSKG